MANHVLNARIYIGLQLCFVITQQVASQSVFIRSALTEGPVEITIPISTLTPSPLSRSIFITAAIDPPNSDEPEDNETIQSETVLSDSDIFEAQQVQDVQNVTYTDENAQNATYIDDNAEIKAATFSQSIFQREFILWQSSEQPQYSEHDSDLNYTNGNSYNGGQQQSEMGAFGEMEQQYQQQEQSQYSNHDLSLDQLNGNSYSYDGQQWLPDSGAYGENDQQQQQQEQQQQEYQNPHFSYEGSPSSAGFDWWQFVEAHNRHRREHCVKDLYWSDNLAASALKWADQCNFRHSDYGLGENLMYVPFDYIVPTDLVNQWIDEKQWYDYNVPYFHESYGHFTQAVWKRTEQIGCASADCGGFQLVVCHYYPRGNVYGQYKENVPPPNCAWK